MKRIEIFKIKKATDEILSNVEVKKTFSGKDIYSFTKLNRRASAENKHTSDREMNFRTAFAEATKNIDMTKDKEISEFEKKQLQKTFQSDLEKLFNEDVEFEIEMKHTVDECDAILKLCSLDTTLTASEHLIKTD